MITERYVDPEIVNLSGGLFENAHVRAPIEPEPGPHLPPRAPARVRNTRGSAWMLGIVAAVLLAGGFAAARRAQHAEAPAPGSAASASSAPPRRHTARSLAPRSEPPSGASSGRFAARARTRSRGSW